MPPSATPNVDPSRHSQVAVVGSGSGGLNCALRLARHRLEVTVVDQDNYHGFWPLLRLMLISSLGA